MTCSNDQESNTESLEAMRARHRAIARYRLYLFDPKQPRGKQAKELERGLTWDEADKKRNDLNAELLAQGKPRFSDPLYGIELTNSWACMSEAARSRHLLLGKCQDDFDC